MVIEILTAALVVITAFYAWATYKMLKASPHSMAHWPSSAGPAAHFAPAGQCAMLLVPP